MLFTELVGHTDIETTNKYFNTVDEILLNEAAESVDKPLGTDRKLTILANYEQNQKV